VNGVVQGNPPPPQSAAMRSFEAQWLDRDPDSLAPVREQAMRSFIALGLPTTRDESWRYTNLRSLATRSFVAATAAPGWAGNAPGPSGSAAPAATLDWLGDIAGMHTIVLVNGTPSPPSSREAVAGLGLESLRDVTRRDAGLLGRRLMQLPDGEPQRWGLLNTALFTDGLYIKVSATLTAPLLLLHVTAAAGANEIAHPRVIIDVAAGCSATIVEHHGQVAHHGDTAAGDALCNSATQISLGRHARLEHYRVFAANTGASHIDTLDIRQAESSRCKQFTTALGGGLVRTTLEAHLEEADAELESFALLVGHESRHVDCVNIARHNARDTRSRQTARAIASGTSRVVFNSKVVVNAGAVHADSLQSCRGLLLSPNAEIDSRPQLEIHTDEVKCAHGATTGRLDEAMLFYMLSRGIDRTTAQSLLVYAFLADVLTGMSEPRIRAAIEAALIAQLPNQQILREFR
jgi:Fe-S cluster assembly protein SufD